MPALPPPSHWFPFLLFLLLLHQNFGLPRDATNQTCTSRPETFRPPCPPFTSTPPFPFSSYPGCGHPSFQVRCASPYSIISVNDLSFFILSYQPNSTSLILSPRPSLKKTGNHTNCSSPHLPSVPTRSISFSGSPFRISDSSCSRLSALRPCSNSNLPDCTRCSWECDVIRKPDLLVHECGSTRESISEQGCQGDVLGFLDNFLNKWGLKVEWNEEQDSYFSSCKACLAKHGVCGFNSSDPKKKFICVRSQSRISPPWIREAHPNRTLILSSVFVFSSLFILIGVVTVIFRYRKVKYLSTEEDPTTLFLHRHRSASLLPPVFSYGELESSTNHFDPKRKIGDGGFGSVYLGQLRDGRIVAVKHLHRQQGAIKSGGKAFSSQSFCNEILILSSIQHPSLVKLHGYCSDPRGLLLVYDYVPNGTLADHLHGNRSSYRKGSLTWQVRMEIALQTAMAMEYLHFSVRPAIVHRDITSSNIFVEKDMRIKVGDFGMSRLLVFSESASSSSGDIWTGPQGTPGYLDPDYHRSFRLTEKSDVYSFGVVLMELVSGMKAVDWSRGKREMSLADLVVSKIQMGLLREVVDPVLVVEGETTLSSIEAAAELAFQCLAADQDDRPDSREVVAELRRIRSRMPRGLVRSATSSSVTIPDEMVKA